MQSSRLRYRTDEPSQTTVLSESVEPTVSLCCRTSANDTKRLQRYCFESTGHGRSAIRSKPGKINSVPDTTGADDADSKTGTTAPANRWSIEPQQIAAHLARRTQQVGSTLLVTIDGPAGAGKSTYAAELATALTELGYPTAVITMDDLYNGWDGLLDPNLEDNLRAWIVHPLQTGQAIRHPVFDWAQGRYRDSRELPKVSALIVEGVGAGHPVLGDQAETQLHLEATESLRSERLQHRTGPPPDQWWPQWQEQEAAYFNQYDPAAHADRIITSER